MFQAIDLFCGAGGLSCGLQKAGFKIALGVDIDSQALKTYKDYFKDTPIIEDDIHNVTGETITSITGITPGSNFLLAGCPPCQGFSSLGKQNPMDEKNKLVYQYLRLINEMQPTFILMENVPGMMKNVGKDIFADVLFTLTQKYQIEYPVLNAADYGVPQTRKRLVLHGARKDVFDLLKNDSIKNSLLLPSPTHCDPIKNNEKKYKDWVTVEESIGDLPSLKAGQEYIGENIYNHVCRKLSTTNIKRLEIIHQNNGSRSSLPKEYVLPCHIKKNVFSDTYSVMDKNKPSPTLTSGCTTISKGRFGHPTQNRGLSLREAARLQSFPDDFIFYGGIGSISLQIGNAVPPLLAMASGSKIYKQMRIVDKLLTK